MANKKKIYVEPDSFFPKEIREKYFKAEEEEPKKSVKKPAKKPAKK